MAERVFYGIVTELECTTEQAAKFDFDTNGPILYECLLNAWSSDEAKVRERAKHLEQQGLGWVRVAKVIVDIPEGDA